ncbi:hypothetical protein ABL78_3432 [Leptomonas seymouri]|uniref:Uncharacterized protein n=1 Tax=Leptomonas seymouri TaxID=5684 RepID=A0A0N1PC52_LEPSE|nr:hypothetical protein ABL78_3432 [Leptomonas seymouri]|eukprot:KPI87483.1 hypothetical protein ABL78_3432 [Leptomonas seymouri]
MQKLSAGPGYTPTKEKRSSVGATAVSVPSKATTDALASINYSAFSRGSLSAKQRRARMLKEFLSAHSTGAQHLVAECDAEHEALWSEYLLISHTRHSREIQRLVQEARQIELNYQQRLQQANDITRCAMSGIEGLLMRLTESGVGISAQTQVLSGEPDPFLATSAEGTTSAAAGEPKQEEQGTPLEEVRGVDPSAPDPHPPAFRIAEADRREFARLKEVFEHAIARNAVRKERGDLTAVSRLSSPRHPSNASASTVQSTVACPAGDAAHEADAVDIEGTTTAMRGMLSENIVSSQEHIRQVNELHYELDSIGEAFTSLMKRVEIQHQQYQAKITAQREALDAAATRTKLADDVLRDTVAQGEVEAGSAVAAVQELSLELRRRMNASEVAIQAALDTIIKKSAEVCVENDALYDYSAIKLNSENCLYAFMSTVERQVVEQINVLRQAQDTVMHLWSRLYKPTLPQQPQAPSAADKETESTGGTSALPKRKNETSTSLPPRFRELLRQSDRSSLLDLAEQLSQHSAEVATLVIRALDDQQARNALHPVEAAAAREDHLRTVATKQLLEMLDAEGYLRSNVRQTTRPLSERITHLVSQYDAYIDFNEQYARALVRQADVERRERSPSHFAFFDARTPTPHLKTAAHSTPAAPAKRVSRAAAQRASAAVSVVDTNKEASVSLPYLQLWEEKQREAHQRQRGLAATTGGLSGTDPTNAVSTGRIVNYLDRTTARASPSQQLVPSPPRASTGGPAAPTPPPSAFCTRRHTAISATALTCASSTPPPPPVPPRTGLASYVLSTYAEKDENAGHLVEPAAQSMPPGKRSTNGALLYSDGDLQFIERQREVFQQLR